MENENLYFIAIVPPKELCDEITAFKIDIREQYKSKAALKVMPHITLKSPFRIPISDKHEIRKWFKKLGITVKPFQLHLKGFGAFANPANPVIYVNPEISDSLSYLQKEVISSFQISYPSINVMRSELKFRPHITIAYRDFEFADFLAAWKNYERKDYATSFLVDRFYLLKHINKEWKFTDTYKLTGNFADEM